MKLKGVWGASLVLAALAASSCEEQQSAPLAEPTPASLRTTAQEARSQLKVLILGSSVNGGMASKEAQAAINLGYLPENVHVVTPEQWSTKTAEDFMLYRAIIIGDSACEAGTAAFDAAVANQNQWGAIVDGFVAIVGGDPSTNNSYGVTEAAVEHVLTRPNKTGMYVALGCAYKDAPPGTPVPLLAPFGEFEVAGVGCAQTAHIFNTSNGAPSYFSQFLSDEGLPGDGLCAARTVFTKFPSNTFADVAIAVAPDGGSLPGQKVYFDVDWQQPYTGSPYILLIGNTSKGTGCGDNAVMSGEQCDLGDGLAGRPAGENQDPLSTCSYSCQHNWCGDGVVDPGEECDKGFLNGRRPDNYNIGTCSAFCRNVNITTSSPPDAICKNVTVVAEYACGVDADINDGSSDPDGDLVGCTQSPAGPYNIGTTPVTLTCKDAAGNEDSCTGTVTVTDSVFPTITLAGQASETFECTAGGAYTDQGATANDLCEGDLTDKIVKSGSVSMGTPGPYTLSYDVTDSSGNSPDAVTRSVTVQDTLKPSLTLQGLANQGLECGTAFNDPGAKASDQCDGDITGAIVKNGTVDHMNPATYPITYNVKDRANQAATEVSRIVTVSDTLKPVVTPKGALNIPLECGAGTYTDEGADANDACAGVLPAVADTVADQGTAGTYTIKYSATDPSGNIGVSATSRTVTVSDTQPPTIALNGQATVPLECGSNYADQGAEANDLCDGPLEPVVTGTVDPTKSGTYSLGYTATDAQGLTASTSRTVNVTDTLLPVVAIKGALNIPLECGAGTYTDPGADANDACDGVLTAVPSVVPDQGQTGSHTISYSATDLAGNVGVSSTSRTVTVSDTQPPTIALNGAATQTLECKTTYTEQGASANDLCDGELTPVMTGSVNTDSPGSYVRNYTATDAQGQSASTSRTVNVTDTLKPVVAIKGALNIPLECGAGTYTDPGADANDACAGVLPAVPSVVPDQGQTGTHTISYSATDPSGNIGVSETSRTVTVSDTQPPTLTMLGPATQTMECKSPYTDPGATADDLCAGDLTGAIVKTGGVNTDLPGDYEVGYSVDDGEGHTASASRTVLVRDTEVPSINVNGPTAQDFECGSTYVDPGATANDACAGDLTPAIVATRSGSQGAGGNFTITYSVTDPSGNEFTSPVVRTVTVEDSEAPTLVLTGSATQALECGDPFVDPGAQAEDVCFGDITASIVRTGNLNNQAPGSYPLTYNVTDPSGNAAPPVQRTVNVSDTKKPLVTVTGELNVNLECGAGPYNEQGATANDACAGPLTPVPSTVPNPNAEGTYTVSYSATDPSGNTGVSATSRTVTVSDTQAPTLALIGPAIQPLECATPYNDPGATANDLCAGNLSGAIVKEGSVNNMQPNDYTLTYNVKDPGGRSAPPVNRTVQVRDTTDPSITVLGPVNDTFACGSGPYPDPGATASDTCAGDLTPAIVRTQSGNPSTPGQFTITYSVTDPSGNEFTSPVVRTVEVDDQEAPTLALLGPGTQSLECGDPFVDPGAQADDLCFGDISSSIVATGTVNNQLPGSYVRTYNVTDPGGNSAPAVQRTVNVSDTEAPSITVLGPLSEQVQCGSGQYPDPGATANDRCAGDLTDSIVVIGGVNTGSAGQYTLSYRVTDPSNNTVTAASSRTVTVVDDAAPTITLLGDINTTLQCGTPYTDPGATANDLCAGDLTGAIVKDGTVNHQVPGNYPVSYTVTDPSNHTATTSRTVTVSDTLAPTLALNGEATQTLECGSMYVDPGATATDVCAGDLTAAVTRDGTVNPGVEGSYPVTYNVQDPTGNFAPSVSRTVNVDDSLAPTIVVLGPLNQEHQCGSAYMDPGATANDACYGDQTGSIVANRSGNPSQPGTFTIEYSVTDPAGNSTTSSVKRTVSVKDDAPPTLVLNGSAAQTLECGTPYVDPGASANDACFGDLTADITRSGTVDSNMPRAAPYTLVYNVTDSAGNIAAPVSREVTVQDTQAPSITVLGPLNHEYECGTTYEDPGATAADTCAGDLTAAIVSTRTPNPNASGNFTITYSVQDPSGNQTTSPVTRSVTVNDDAPPTIALNGEANQFLECSRNAYVDPGARATDVCVGGPVPYTVTGSVNMQVDGVYTLQYSATDPAGNTSATLTRTVNVNDSVGPAITLNGPTSVKLECNLDQYTDLGATAEDVCSGPAQVFVDESEVDESKTGAYLVRYTATDASGNSFSAVRNVLVEDHLQPTIALNAPNPMRLECGIDTFQDPGATATDLCQGDVSASIFIEFNNINRNVEGNYIVRYQAQDGQTESVTAVRDVEVDDKTGPAISITGTQNPVVECGSTPNLKDGVTATDACYGILASSAITATPATLPSTTGNYTVTYTAIDPVGNASANPAATRTFTVVDTTVPELCSVQPDDDNDPNTPPPCLPFTDQDIEYECTGIGNNEWEPPIVAALDLCEGTVPVHPYNTGDDDQDGIPGCDCNYFPCGGEGVPEGDDPTTACDEEDFGPGPSTENEGLYYVQYLAWDESYSEIQGAILSVYVKDTIKPTITLLGPPTVQTQCWTQLDVETDPDPYQEPGVDARDICYGDLNQEVFGYGDIIKSQPGTYNIEYQVRDGAYNWADPAVRTVEVIDNIAPAVVVKPTLNLAPANGELRQIDLTECVVEIKDRCEGYMNINNRAQIGQITSNEPGSDAGDIVVLSNSRFQLRVEPNSNGTTRLYTVPFTVVDNSGNVTTSQCTFDVNANPFSSPQSTMGSGTLAGR